MLLPRLQKDLRAGSISRDVNFPSELCSRRSGTFTEVATFGAARILSASVHGDVILYELAENTVGYVMADLIKVVNDAATTTVKRCVGAHNMDLRIGQAMTLGPTYVLYNSRGAARPRVRYTILQYTILYYTIVLHTIIYYNILFYTIICVSMI